MNDRNFHHDVDNENKKGSKSTLRTLGIIALSVALAVLTVVVISLNLK